MTTTQKLQSYRNAIAQLDPNGVPVARILKEPASQKIRSSKRCLVLDAAFNPPTIAHWELAQAGAQASDSETVLLQLSVANVDKGIEGADLGQRLLMMEAASDEDIRTGVCICSHARFIDKASALAHLSPKTRFVFAIGYDTLVRLFDPKYYEDMPAELDVLFGMAEFAVANRGESDQSNIEEYLNHPALRNHNRKIHQVLLAQHFAGISSSKTRDAIQAGSPYQNNVSSTVAEVIKALDLYKA